MFRGFQVYCILKEATTFEMCESLNHCYPPNNDIKRQMKPLMPPVVKGRLQAKGGLRKQRNKLKGRDKSSQGGILKIVQITDVHVQPVYAIVRKTNN